MTEQTIPAEKVRELADKYNGDMPTDPHFLLGEIRADIRDLLPAQQPTTGLLGRWATWTGKDGAVLVCSDCPDKNSSVLIATPFATETICHRVLLTELTFPEQVTKPEDVPAGEAWLVRDKEGSEFPAIKSASTTHPWRFFDSEYNVIDGHRSRNITLVSPLTPERPGKDDLQVWYDALKEKYDELETKYREAQARITELEKVSIPCSVTNVSEYHALPAGSVVAQPGELNVYAKNDFGGWDRLNTTAGFPSLDLAGSTRMVLRYGWGDKQSVPEAIAEAKQARDKETGE